MADENFDVIEWSVENFSYWNKEIHGVMISSPEFSYRHVKISLFPRGFKGQDKQLRVSFWLDFDVQKFSGDLSFISSDGSLLCTQKVAQKRDERVLKLVPGLEFDELVSQIRKNEPYHKDQLTLRFRGGSEYSTKMNMEYQRTTIDVFDFTVKTSSKMFERSEGTTIPTLWFTYYNNQEKRVENVSLLFCNHGLNSELKLQPFNFKKKFLAITLMSVLSHDKEVRTEEKEHLFFDNGSSMTLALLAKEEVSRDGFSLILSVKIIPSNMCKYQLSLISGEAKEITIMPSNSIRLLRTSVPKKDTLPAVAPRHPSESVVNILSKELMSLYQEQDFSDFQLRCGNVSFATHRSILSARSPVFKSMLSADMTASGSMDIEDLDVPTLARFLAFLYSGIVHDLQWENALKLYYAADKYQIPNLKVECASVLWTEVCIANVCEILSFADKHQDDELIAVAHDFIWKNYNEVLKSDEWNSFMGGEPLLAVKTLTHVGKRNSLGEISISK